MQLADPDFDQPKRIDLLLGADILPEVLMLYGPADSVKVMETKFGHAIMATYPSDPSIGSRQASVQLAQERPEPQQEQVDFALTRFWEVKQPTKQVALFTPEEN